MFKKVNSGKYVIDTIVVNEIIRDVKDFLHNPLEGVEVNSDLHLVTIRKVVAYKISILVVKHMKEELVKQTFVAIQYAGDVSGVASVGWYDDKLVYGTLS